MSIPQDLPAGDPVLFGELAEPKRKSLGHLAGWLLDVLRGLAAEEGFAFAKEEWLVRRLWTNLKSLRTALDRLHLAGLICWRKARWKANYAQNLYRPLPDAAAWPVPYVPPPIKNPRIRELFKTTAQNCALVPENHGAELRHGNSALSTEQGRTFAPNHGAEVRHCIEELKGEEVVSSSSKGNQEGEPTPTPSIAAAADFQKELEKEGIVNPCEYDPDLLKVALPWFRLRLTDPGFKLRTDRTGFLAGILNKPEKFGFRKTSDGWIRPLPEGQEKAAEAKRHRDEANAAAKKLAATTKGQIDLGRMHLPEDSTEEEKKRMEENQWRDLPEREKEEIRQSVRRAFPGMFRGKTDRDTMFHQACLMEMKKRAPLPAAALAV
jgi:hypothetical protein